MRVLLLGGTSEARDLARLLVAQGHAVELHTLTAYGKNLGEESVPGSDVRSGALDEAALTLRARVSDVLVDATHPHAQKISVLAIGVAQAVGIPFLRLEREVPAEIRGNAIVVSSHEQAAREAARRVTEGGTAFLTIGSRNLEIYASTPLPPGAKWVARILPDADSLAACHRAGLSPGQIIAMQGPTSEELDRAFLRHLDARVLVTKESGTTGGTPQKIAAAAAEGIAAIVVARPALDYPWVTQSPERLVAHLGTLSAQATAPQKENDVSFWHIYTGEGKGKSTAAIGLAARAAGAGLRVCFIQFLKGGAESGELPSLRKLGVHVVRPATKPTGILRGKITPEDREAASAAIREAEAALGSAKWDLVILDEIHGAVRHGLVEENAGLTLVRNRHPGTEVVTTGRAAPQAWREAADLVTHMDCSKHYVERGIVARRGIEF